MEMSPDLILDYLRTRGFEKGFQTTPLREFTGILDSITGEMVESRDGKGTKRLRVLYNFSEVIVISSTEPYTYPIAQIGIPYSDRERSMMGIFGMSVDKVINADVPEDAPPEAVKGQEYLVGKTIHMKMTPGHMMWDGSVRQETPRECWEVVAITEASTPGIILTVGTQPTALPVTSAKTAAPRALELLDGKTEHGWHQVVFTDPLVKGDAGLITQIITKQFIPAMEAANLVKKGEDGIYHL